MSGLNKSTITGVHFGPVKHIVLSPDGQYLLSLGSNDGMINVVDLKEFDIANDFNMASITNDQIYSLSSIKTRNSFLITDDGKQVLNVNWPDISQTNNLIETDMIMNVLAVDPKGNLVSYSGEDPQITIINYDNPEEQTQLFDNIASVVYLGFGPVCQTLVSINSDGNIHTYSQNDSYSEGTLQNQTVKTVFSGVCWSADSQLLVSDSEKKGIFHVFHFPSEGYATGKFESLGIITAMSISETNLLAACDASQKIVISKFPNDFIERQQLPILQLFDPKTESITYLFWFCNNLFAGDSEGSIHKWGQIEADEANEIEVVKSVMESDHEIEEFQTSDEDDGITQSKHIIVTPKHSPKPPKSHEKLDDYDEEEDYDEDEQFSREHRNPFRIDEASEASSYSDSELPIRKPTTVTKPLREKLTTEQVAERLKEKYGDYSTTPTETESESDEEGPKSKEEMKRIREYERKQKELDKKFIANSESASSDGDNEEEEDKPEMLTDSDLDHDDGNKELYQFMPGSTKQFENKRIFLCFNLMAKIFLRENNDDSTSIDVEYNDLMKYKAIHFKNSDNFFLSTVTPTGVAFASSTKVQYRAHHPWATDSECLIKMDSDEKIDLLAAGNGWFAVSTTLKRLRIFMGSGFETAIFAIPQRPMTMVGGGNLLGIIFGHSLNDDLSYMLLDVKARQELASGNLPISPPIKWIGIENRTFYVLGNRILYALIQDFGHQFVPVCDARPKNIEENESFWCVGIEEQQLWGVILGNGREEPEPITNLTLKALDIEPQTVEEASRNYIMKRIDYCNSARQDKEQFGIKMDTALLREFSNAAKHRLYQRMLHIGLQLVSKKGQMIALNFIGQKDDVEMKEIGDQLQQFWASVKTPEEEDETEPEEGAKSSTHQSANETDEQPIQQDSIPSVDQNEDDNSVDEGEEENSVDQNENENSKTENSEIVVHERVVENEIIVENENETNEQKESENDDTDDDSIGEDSIEEA